MIHGVRNRGSNFVAVQAALSNVPKSFLDHLLAAISRMIDVGQQIQSSDRRLGEDEYQVHKTIVIECGGRPSSNTSSHLLNVQLWNVLP